ncbi:hypothetical protein EK21DRAFT_98852 [Setomelanomma holmii]|uniref:Uncharacterized protein n=1 Tax=Setomelanomma holmii TaxID=210430 RepID=A0A9P4HDF6_9PLEO|nr:hypothetical protein EK21DRAFT_98852 [Setomelanomma holmii]
MEATTDGAQHSQPENEPIEIEATNDESQEVMSVQEFPNEEDHRPSHENPVDVTENTEGYTRDATHNPEVEAGQDELDDGDDGMGQFLKDNQDEVMETIEQELGLDPGALDPTMTEGDDDFEDQEDTAMANQEEDHQDSDDATMNDLEPESTGNTNVRDFETREPHGNAKPREEDRNEDREHTRQDTVDSQEFGQTNFQPVQVDDEYVDNDSSTLFQSAHHVSSANMPPPPRPSATPVLPGNSTYARIRNLQNKFKEKKNAEAKRQAAHQYQANPDNEAYLEAVLSSITPASSTPAPAVDEDKLAHRQANAEFAKQKRYYDEQKRKNGHLTFRQDVEWLKIRGNEDARIKKRLRDLAKANQNDDDETDLFPEARPQPQINTEIEDDSDDTFGLNAPGPSRKRQRRDMPLKASKQMSMQEAELESMKVALDAHEDLPKKKTKTQRTDDDSQNIRASGKGKGKGKAKATKSKSKTTRSTAASKIATGSRKTAKGKRDVEHAIKQATSLFNSNVFEQQAGDDEADQPTFRSRNKTDALKELIASIPLEDKKQARADISVLVAATKDFDGKGSCKALGGNWLVKGMKTSLKSYQVLGSAFMRRRENAAEQPKGGLMADQMGLGKTLMMLANIVNGQPPKGQHPRTTLLVASPSLLTQWGQEIEQHTDCGLKIMRYGAGTRIDSNQAFEILKHHDIILTTYSEVMKSYPKNEPPIECQTAEQKMTWWKNVYDTQRGVLHRMMFLRIVLDEAQAIKNHQGRTSIACRALMAQHKWALSGTPIMNNLSELYPYFKFLGVPHTGSFKIFKHNYCDTNDTENTERLLVRLSQFMIRRTHADKMFNAPILKLPMAGQSTFFTEFNSVERCIYDIVRQRFAKNINMWQKKGELEKSYSNALVMLLRLRQLTAHVLMLQFVMRDLLELEDIERIKEVVKEHAADSNTRRGRTIIAVRKQLEKHAIEAKRKAAAIATAKAAAEAAGNEYVPEADDEEAQEAEAPEPEDDEDGLTSSTGQFGAGNGGSGKSFGKDYDFKPYLRSLKTGDSWEKVRKKAKCSWCGKNPKKPWIASCSHLICAAPCLENAYIAAAEVEKDHAPCKACGVTPTSLMEFEMDENDEFEPVASATRSKAQKKAKKQKERRDREDIAEDWLSLAGEEVLPSAKTLAIKAQILNWTRKDPKVKVIVYTQFLAMVRILNKICQKEGWAAEQYIGTMSFTARDKAISNFATNDRCNILLASLRCGGLGLNLTMASRVIMVDPWWNSASEQQAFCRVFRIGQKEETYMSRLCVRNTIDERLVEMQKRKDKEINEVMEDNGKTTSKLGIRDLMRLFGNLNDDADGKPFILVDNPDPRGGFRADRDDEGYADEF